MNRLNPRKTFLSFLVAACLVLLAAPAPQAQDITDLDDRPFSRELANGGTSSRLPGTAARADESQEYCVPYSPGAGDFALGFGISNMDNDSAAEVAVEHFGNGGEKLGQEDFTIPAGGHASFMSGQSSMQGGWARVTASEPVDGMALVFGYGEDPMFDMDFKAVADKSRSLVAAHVDSGGWVSKAMLANPNYIQTHVALTFHPTGGGAVQTADLTIPANGSVQYDLSVFGNGSGAVSLESDKDIAGFLLYDGRGLEGESDFNYAGGLSMNRSIMSFASVSAGRSHTLGLKADGTLWGWGFNSYGQLGNGKSEDASPLVLVGTGFAAVSAGVEFSLGLKTDGSLWSWGRNEDGQLGDGTTNDSISQKLVGEGFVSVDAGARHCLAIKEDGALWAWGRNSSGEVGDGSTSERRRPVQVGDGFTAVGAGSQHSLGLKADGSLWAWGSNQIGQLGDGSGTSQSLPVKVGEGFAAIAAGAGHSLAVKSDGSLWAWGYNHYHELGDGGDVNQLLPVQIGEGFAAVSAGVHHSMGLKTDGSLWMWGNWAWRLNQFGQGDNFTTESSVPLKIGEGFISIAAGDEHSLATREDGSLWAWGTNGYGELGDGAVRMDPYLLGFDSLETPGAGYVYCVPCVPAEEDFGLGFGVYNANGGKAANVHVEYFGNDGSSLGAQTQSITAGGHASFMTGSEFGQGGWARITSDQYLYGTALAFGHEADPMFDMDFKMYKCTRLMSAHADTSGGWVSKAMLANPNDGAANVLVTFQPSDGGSAQSAGLTIPAMGAVQYDLASLGYMAGPVSIASDQGLVGFLLYDGRETGHNFVGGLSLIEEWDKPRLF